MLLCGIDRRGADLVFLLAVEPYYVRDELVAQVFVREIVHVDIIE